MFWLCIFHLSFLPRILYLISQTNYHHLMSTLITGDQSDLVKIRGPKDDVDGCHQYLKKMVRDLAESNHQVKVSIFRQFHKFIIGKGGANINKVSGLVFIESEIWGMNNEEDSWLYFDR